MKSYLRVAVEAVKKEVERRKQCTFCYCPICHRDLVAQRTALVEDKELVKYECRVCGTLSEWNFDISPAPILVDYTCICRQSRENYFYHTGLEPKGIYLGNVEPEKKL